MCNFEGYCNLQVFYNMHGGKITVMVCNFEPVYSVCVDFSCLTIPCCHFICTQNCETIITRKGSKTGNIAIYGLVMMAFVPHSPLTWPDDYVNVCACMCVYVCVYMSAGLTVK